MAELLSYIPDEMQIHAEILSDFRAQPRGNCEPLAPSKLPFINNRMYLSKSLGARSALMQQSYFAAKLFDAKEKLLLSSTYLGNGQSVKVSLTCLAGLKYLILDLLQVVGQSRDFPAWWLDIAHLILCLWLRRNDHQDFMHSLTTPKHPPGHFPFLRNPTAKAFS